MGELQLEFQSSRKDKRGEGAGFHGLRDEAQWGENGIKQQRENENENEHPTQEEDLPYMAKVVSLSQSGQTVKGRTGEKSPGSSQPQRKVAKKKGEE